MKLWGGRRPVPEGDLRRFYDLAMDGIAESQIAIEVSTAGLRKPVGELYPAPAFLQMCVDAGCPVALSSDAHVPGDVGRDYDAALELLERARRRASSRSSSAASAGWRRSDERCRTGLGWDSHRFVAGRPLILGGVIFPDAELGLDGHSDADVLTHAIMDALLGAAGLDDIGVHFPDTDGAYEGADSILLLKQVLETLARAAACASCTSTRRSLMEQPKIGPYRAAIRDSLAAALGLDRAHVNVKASTGEGMGFVGSAGGRRGARRRDRARGAARRPMSSPRCARPRAAPPPRCGPARARPGA